MDATSPNNVKRSSGAYLAFALLAINALCLSLAGCATWKTPPTFDESGLRSRAVSADVKGVRLSAAVLSREDSERMFGVDINRQEVQPIWIEVKNGTDQALWDLRYGTDPNIFSPLEVAWSFHTAFSSQSNATLDDYFDSLSFQNPIAPRSTQDGIIFTNPHQEIRLLNVDILGQGEIFPFTLFLYIPDDVSSKRAHELLTRYAEKKVTDYQDVESLHDRLEQLGCCASSADGKEPGDPINVILVGHLEDISAAVVRRGFRAQKLEYDDNQYLFGRPPDIVVRKTNQGGAPANWIRGWLAPFRYQGEAVILAQAGRPVGGRFVPVEKSKSSIVHPNVDDVRNTLIGDMMYSGGLGKLAFVAGVGEVGRNRPRQSLNGASYYTDGKRAVLFFVTRPRSLSEVEILDWYPIIELRERETVRENQH